MKSLITLPLCILLHYCSAQTILSEKFSSDVLPPGWTQETMASDGGWLTGDNFDIGSAIFPVLAHGNFIGTNDKCYCDKSNDFLKSPAIDLSSYSSIWLCFEYSFLDFAPQQFTVEVSTDGGATWDVLDDLPSSAAGYFGWWQKNYYDISSYAGYDNVKIGFRYSDGGDWWSYGATLDNIRVFQPLANDIALDSLNISSAFAEAGTGITLSGVITNYGTDVIHSFDAEWNDGSSANTVNITGLDIEPFETASFIHTVDYVPYDAVQYNVSLSVLDPNGSPDAVADDNTLLTTLHGTSSKPHKNAVAELATGTWCAWCVRGHVYMDSMYLLYPDNFIGIDVHNADPMTVDNYDSLMYAYQNHLNYNGGAAYPSIIAEHVYYMDPLNMPERMPAYINETVPLYMEIFGEYNDTTGIASVNLKTNFVTKLSTIDYRINLILTEDSVTGTGSAWNQWNAYADGYYGDMGGYEALPDPVPASLMHYDHVARYLADGWEGAAGSLPSTVGDGEFFYHLYDVVIDPAWNTNKLNVIGTVRDAQSGEIINAAVMRLLDLTAEVPEDTSDTDTTVLSLQDVQQNILSIYPNPADEYFTANLTLPSVSDVLIEIYDITGQRVDEHNYGKLNGQVYLRINSKELDNGIYYITCTVNGRTSTEKLTLLHR